MGEFLVSREDRFGARMIPLLSAIRLGRKIGFDVKCIWNETDDMPKWHQIFESKEICSERFSVLEFLENKGKIDAREIKRPNCDISFEPEVGLYLHRFQDGFEEDNDGKLIHLDNPVGIYLLKEENLDEVIKELSELFISIPFNEKIKDGFGRVDDEIRNNGISRDQSISIHIRRGDALDFAKTDTIALFERIVPIHEYISRINDLEKMMDLKHIIVGSDDPEMADRIDSGTKDKIVRSIYNFIDKDEFSDIEFDIIDLYLLSKSCCVSSGFSAYSILAGIIGRFPVHRLDLNQDLEGRLLEIEREVYSQRDTPEIGKKAVMNAYSYVHRRMMKESDFARARKVASEMEERFLDESEPKNLLGNLAFLEGDYDEAARLHRSSIEIDPMNAHFHVALAHALRKNNSNESQSIAEKAFLLDPLNQNSIRLLADIYRSKGEYKMYLLSLIYLEMLQNYSGANIGAITGIVKKITEIEGENEGFEGEINTFISDKVVTKGENLVEVVRSKIISEGSAVSRKIKSKIDSKIPGKKIREEILAKLDENKDSESSLVFSTERFIDGRRALIGGLADRMKGASTVMLLSIALGRRFEIEWGHPEEIRRIFDYSGYDWSLSEDADVNLEVDLIDRNFTTEIRKNMKEGPLEGLFPEEKNRIKIFCNSVDVEVGKNDEYASRFSDYFMSLNRTDLVGSFLSLLEYRPGLEESMILMAFMSRIEHFDKTVAVHFRTGGDGGWRDPDMDDESNVEKLIQRASEIASEHEGRVGVYFACDSDNLKKSVLRKYSSELDIFSISIPLAHIDRSEDRDAVMGSRFAMMENFVISMCDEILTGKGAFAELSANRIFIEPWRYF